MPEAPTIDAVRTLLADLPDPETGRGLGVMEQLGEVRIDGAKITAEVALTSWAGPVAPLFKERCELTLRDAFPGSEVSVTITEHARPADKIGQVGLTAKSVIAVGSGKGGVGKSTIATSLALALQAAGSKVGLMDADVYGPSVPHLLGVDERPTAVGNRLQPIDVNGLKMVSMGLLVPKEEAVIWRGPMLHGAVTQFLKDTEWGDLDYLIIDMPPGTGDIALTLSQLLPLTGSVVVCTPQEVALLDAVKAIAMFRKVKIPVLGMVENMSYFLCPDNGKRYDIFGHGGAREKAAELDVPLLGEAPIQMAIRERGDAGETAGNLQDADAAPVFRSIATRLVTQLMESHAAAPPVASLPVL